MKSILFDVLDTLSRHNVPYCLVEGTLLRIVREGELIPWDHDLDIGVRHEDLITKIPALVKEFLPRFKVTVLSFPYRYPREIKLQIDDITVDIVNYDMGCYNRRPVRFNTIHDQYALSWHDASLFESYMQYRFDGQTVFLPRDPLAYIIETYGPNWHDPKQYGEYIRYPVLPTWFEYQLPNDMNWSAIQAFEKRNNPTFKGETILWPPS